MPPGTDCPYPIRIWPLLRQFTENKCVRYFFTWSETKRFDSSTQLASFAKSGHSESKYLKMDTPEKKRKCTGKCCNKKQHCVSCIISTSILTRAMHGLLSLGPVS